VKYQILSIGKAKAGPQQALFSFYQTRLNPAIELLEFELKNTSLSPVRKVKEAEVLQAHIPEYSFVIALDETGKSFSSTQFAAKLQDIKLNSYKAVCFIIGGADGLDPGLLKRADLVLCLGQMTWPHMLVRGLIAEQIYRAECILSGHPYHRD
jgi:Uncharacterized conserved protein